MSPFVAEVLGTMMLILLGVGTVANVVLKGTKGNSSGWIVITFGWGLAVFCGVVVAGPVSGAHINPAVTIGLAVAGKFPWADAPLFIAAQMLGAFIGAVLAWLAYKDHFDATEDQGAQLGTFSTGPEIRNPLSNILTEAVGTFVLMFVILHFAQPEFSASTVAEAKIGLGSIGALPVALLVVVIGIALGGPTGYAINPARDLAPRIAHAILPIKGKGSSDWSYAWIPVVGPILGASLAALLFAAF